jgi:hypothetical protein
MGHVSSTFNIMQPLPCCTSISSMIATAMCRHGEAIHTQCQCHLQHEACDVDTSRFVRYARAHQLVLICSSERHGTCQRHVIPAIKANTWQNKMLPLYQYNRGMMLHGHQVVKDCRGRAVHGVGPQPCRVYDKCIHDLPVAPNNKEQCRCPIRRRNFIRSSDCQYQVRGT